MHEILIPPFTRGIGNKYGAQQKNTAFAGAHPWARSQSMDAVLGSVSCPLSHSGNTSAISNLANVCVFLPRSSITGAENTEENT